LCFLPEAEAAARSQGIAPYEIAKVMKKHPQSRILAAAELVGVGVDVLPEQVKHLKDSDSAVRFWPPSV
jgi:hypothetical protein